METDSDGRIDDDSSLPRVTLASYLLCSASDPKCFSREQTITHPAWRLFSSRTSSRLRRALDYSFLFVLTPSSSNQNAVFFLRPLTGAFRHNGHANSTLSDAAASFVSFYCRSHSAYASMRGMKRAVEWKSGSRERLMPSSKFSPTPIKTSLAWWIAFVRLKLEMH